MTAAADGPGGDQAALWQGAGATGWVQLEDLVDRLYRPVEDALVHAVADAAGAPDAAVLDVGCGTGGTTVAIARRLGPAARCTGVDVSEAMLAAARARAERASVPVDFVTADAQHHPFPTGRVDVVTSRWGVMFFDDLVAAFANLHRATRPGGALRVVVWRSAEENEFMAVPDQAAAGLVDVPPRATSGPGAFALADPAPARAVLERAGWRDVDLRPLDLDCTMPESELPAYVLGLGPLGRALTAAGADDELRARVAAAVVPAYDRWVHDGVVHLPVACWLVHATA